MKSFIAILALAALAAADVSHLKQNSEADAQIENQEADVRPDGYQYTFKTSNGIFGQESGSLKDGPDGPAITVQGSNEHTAPDGEVIRLTYTADEDGFHPQGSHLPTPPPAEEIPDFILRALEYIRTHPPKDTKN